MLNFFRQKPQEVTLNDLLQSSTAREELLGVLRVAPPSLEEVGVNINRTLTYARTEDYKIWAKAAWQEVVGHIVTLLDPKLSNEQSNFERGALLATVNLLRLSHAAHMNQQRVQKQLEAKTVASRR